MAALLVPPGHPTTAVVSALDSVSRVLAQPRPQLGPPPGPEVMAAASRPDIAGALCEALGSPGPGAPFRLRCGPDVVGVGPEALPVATLARLAATLRVVSSPQLPKSFLAALLSTLHPAEWRAFFQAAGGARLNTALRAVADGPGPGPGPGAAGPGPGAAGEMPYRRAAVHRRLRALVEGSLDSLGFSGGAQGGAGPPGAPSLGVTLESSLHELAVPCVAAVKALRLRCAPGRQVAVTCHFSGLGLRPEDTAVPEAADAATAEGLRARRRAQVITAALRGVLSSLALHGNDVAVLTDVHRAGVNPVELLRVLAPLLRDSAGRGAFGVAAVVAEFPNGAVGVPAAAAGQLLPVPLLVVGPADVVPCVEHLTAAGSGVSVGVVSLGCSPAATLFHDLEWEAAAACGAHDGGQPLWLPYVCRDTTARCMCPCVTAALAEAAADPKRRPSPGPPPAAVLEAMALDAIADSTDAVSVDADGRCVVAQRDGAWVPVAVPLTAAEVTAAETQPAPTEREAYADHSI